jgi:hypothetical protein
MTDDLRRSAVRSRLRAGPLREDGAAAPSA